ncbi:cardiolipin synthase [Kineococcus radiotolerans]|uniref:Cardiolipin synthase n=1 Tax=Kineococcus radiotolerans TaxID=131568 RepID=A0A7W4TP04_KINRA|nr:phospholipase D-like domain-containing protein [Kineococcus radiotolerans]MBB2902459.1 cardiolipin synthase [Kineococcus radiotolerans]
MKAWAVGSVPENRRPGSSSAWLLLILFLPVVGLPLFFLLGSPYVTGRRHRVQEAANRAIAERVEELPDLPPGFVADEHLASVLELNRRLTALPCVSGDHRRLLPDGEFVAALCAAVASAERTVDVEFYIAALDATTEPFFDALRDAVARGVRVRFLYDHLGARRYPGHAAMNRRLTADGVEWHRMMPIDPLRRRWRRPDLRNHRKLVVVDGRTGFVGSQNLIDPGYLVRKNVRAGRRWVDLNVELTGSVVQSLEAVFATDWYAETGEVLDEVATPTAHTVPGGSTGAFQVVPSGPGFPTEPNLRMFTALIHAATRRVSIVSPYFVPDESLEQAITTAAYRGVEVELFVSERADQFMVHHAQCSYYTTLLRAGVRIHRLPYPAVLHSKVLVVDGARAVIGSSNMDMRSFNLDYEVSLLGLEPDFVRQLSEVVDGYRARSRELTPEAWSQRPYRRRYLDNVMRLTAALQ